MITLAKWDSILQILKHWQKYCLGESELLAKVPLEKVERAIQSIYDYSLSADNPYYSDILCILMHIELVLLAKQIEANLHIEGETPSDWVALLSDKIHFLEEQIESTRKKIMVN